MIDKHNSKERQRVYVMKAMKRARVDITDILCPRSVLAVAPSCAPTLGKDSNNGVMSIGKARIS